MSTHYEIVTPYDPHVHLETPNIVEALRYAAAVSMHAGKSMQMNRVDNVIDAAGAVVSSTRRQLVTLNPQSYDFRHVKPDLVIAIKAMAHELVTNIDEVVPEFKKEGIT